MHSIPRTVGLVLLLWGCGPPRPPLEASSEHFQVYSDLSCSSRTEWLEHTYEALGAYLGVVLSANTRITYVQYASPAVASTACGGLSSRCALNNTVISTQPVDYHEIVHVLTNQWGVSPPNLFKEGLAETLGCGTLSDNSSVAPGDYIIDELLGGFDAGDSDERFGRYPSAQSFVYYLIHTYGRDSFLALYRNIGRVTSESAANDAFMRYLGVALNVAVQGWIERGPQNPNAVCMPIPLCQAPPISAGELVNVMLTCGPGADPVLPQLGAFRSVAVEGGMATVLQLRTANDMGWISLYGCGVGMPTLATAPDSLRTVFHEQGLEFGGGRMMVADLRGGQYFVDLRTDSDSEIDVELARSEIAMSGTCGGSGALELSSPQVGELMIALQNDTDRWVGLAPTSDVYLTPVFHADVNGVPEIANVELCADNCEMPCQRLGGDARIMLAGGRRTNVHLVPHVGQNYGMITLFLGWP